MFPRFSAAAPIPGIHDKKSLVMSISASTNISMTDSSSPITAFPNTGPYVRIVLASVSMNWIISIAAANTRISMFSARANAN